MSIYIPLISHLSDELLDEDTETWPVPMDMIDTFKNIKNNYRVQPLVVYDTHNQFVEPLEVNNALKNALIEIHFGIVHFKIGRGGDLHDSFTAVPKQIIILKTAPIQTPNTYKRKNIRSGPVRPKKFEDFRTTEEPADPKGKAIASGSRA